MSEYILSVSMVVYNPTFEELKPVLQSVVGAMTYLAKQLKKPCILYFIDNSSTQVAKESLLNTPTSKEIDIRYIFSDKNLGYGTANNLVLGHLDSDFHLVINPDVTFSKTTLNDAIKILQDDPQLGLLSPAVYSNEHEQQYFCKNNPTFFIMFLRSFAPAFLKNTFEKQLNAFENKQLDYNQAQRNIPFLTGCFLLFKTPIFNQLNGFDPRFFLYFEDADISRRTLEFSDSIYHPFIKITHAWSRGAHNNPFLRKQAMKSGLQYCWKWLWKRPSKKHKPLL